MHLLRREFLSGMLATPVLSAAPPAKIRVGCQTRVWGVPIKDTQRLLEILDDLRSTGYEGFETNYASLQANFNDPAPLRAEFEKRKVQLIGLHVGAKLTGPATIEKERALIEGVARAVKAFGGTHLIVSAAGIPPLRDGKLDSEVLKFKAAELSRAGKVCRDLGLHLASHNHLQETERNGEELIKVLSETDLKLVSLLFDVGYGYLAKLDTPGFVRKYGSRVAGFHVRDYQGTKEAPMGEGEVDLKGFAKAVHETRWNGWVILETNQVKGVNSRDVAQADRTYMRKELGI